MSYFKTDASSLFIGIRIVRSRLFSTLTNVSPGTYAFGKTLNTFSIKGLLLDPWPLRDGFMIMACCARTTGCVYELKSETRDFSGWSQESMTLRAEKDSLIFLYDWLGNLISVTTVASLSEQTHIPHFSTNMSVSHFQR